MEFVQSTTQKVLEYAFEDPIFTTDSMNDKNLAKINKRFGTKFKVQRLDQ